MTVKVLLRHAPGTVRVPAGNADFIGGRFGTEPFGFVEIQMPLQTQTHVITMFGPKKS